MGRVQHSAFHVGILRNLLILCRKSDDFGHDTVVRRWCCCCSPLLELAVDDDDIDGHAQSVDGFHFEHRALQKIRHEHDLLRQPLLQKKVHRKRVLQHKRTHNSTAICNAPLVEEESPEDRSIDTAEVGFTLLGLRDEKNDDK